MPDVIINNLAFLAQGLAITLQLSALTILAGTLLGLGLAIGFEAIALVVPALGLAALATVWLQRGDSMPNGDAVQEGTAADRSLSDQLSSGNR